MTLRQKFRYLQNGGVRKIRAILLTRLAGLSHTLTESPEAIFDAYHVWFYGSGVPFRLTWEGVPTLKSPLDMWNYQQIIWDLRPSLVIELGTNKGGSALFFSRVLEALGDDRCVLTFDVEQAQVDDRLMQRPNVVFCRASTTSREAADTISAMRRRYPGSVFVILDSDHTKEHVLQELRSITPLLATGDRVVVEDTNINGRPVLPGWGPGPFEAVEAFLLEAPDAYTRDVEAESLFGWSFATGGFLIRL